MKSQFLKIPVIGSVIRWSVYVLRLPNKFDEQARLLQVATNSTSEKLHKAQLLQNDKLADLTARIVQVDDKLVDLTHQLHVLNEKGTSVSTKHTATVTLADDHSLDQFYIAFENHFRGPEEDIIERQKVYLPQLKKLKKVSSKRPVLDIGCGRGEFLEVLKQAGLPSKGLDLNSTMVKRSRDKGFNVIEQDALSFLIDQKTDSLAAITGFHIVEHIPFSDLMKIFSEAYRTVMRGGFVLFETPNPENVSVGSNTFYYDPSHLKPVPPKLLVFCLEFVGFSKVEILPLHPEIETPQDDKLTSKMAHKLFGPRDYAVIAYK